MRDDSSQGQILSPESVSRNNQSGEFESHSDLARTKTSADNSVPRLLFFATSGVRRVYGIFIRYFIPPIRNLWGESLMGQPGMGTMTPPAITAVTWFITRVEVESAETLKRFPFYVGLTKSCRNAEANGRFHYRITVALLLIGVALVSSKEYIGEHIKCIFPNEKKEVTAAIERFCFFMGTFTVVKLHNKSVLNMEIAHPGVGPYVESSGENIIKHMYYQWVPFVLFFQAICFYFPHLIWREIEKGKMKALLNGLKEIDIINSSFKRRSFEMVQLQIQNRLYINRSWTFCLILCELLNLLNLIFQVYITDVFLGYRFMDLGPKVYWDPKGDEFNPLDVVFPKVTKCSFRKFGPSGSIQYHDIMCVMAMNIVNEKIYTVLWFWYVILFILSVLILLWRALSFLLRKSVKFNLYVFKMTALGNINSYNLITVMRHLNFGEWMFLRYLASNMTAKMFDEFIAQIAETYENGSKLFDAKPKEEEVEEEMKKPLVDL